MSRHESLTLKEKFFRGTAATTAALGLLGLAGCANNVEALPSPSTTTSSEAPSPTTSPSNTSSETSTPKPVETQKPTSGIVVDYTSFANWNSITPGTIPNYEHEREGSKEWLCDQVFEANGIASPENRDTNQDWKGDQIVAYMQPRLELAWKLNMDKSSPENATIAKNLLECLTSGTESDAYEQLSNSFDTARGSSIEIELPLSDMSKITRESTGQWLSNNKNLYVVEYATTDGLGDKLYPKFTFEWSKSNDYRISKINNLTANDDNIVWGKNPPVVLDQSRASAPYSVE